MSQKQTSKQSDCDHISKVLEWAYELRDGQMNQYVTLYGCTECSEQSKLKPFPGRAEIGIDHSKCGSECFRCKAKGLQLNTGDAGRDISDKAWNSRLKKYRDAKADGIQPANTNPAVVEASIKASETLGVAYNAETMVRADKITKGTASIMKEIGDI